MYRSKQLLQRGYGSFSRNRLIFNRQLISNYNRYLSTAAVNSETNIKSVVHEQYSNTAKNFDHSNKLQKETASSYAKVFGYSADDLLQIGDGNMGLSCGNPVSLANIKKNEIVLDLGCGAGMDMFLAHKYIDNNGMIIGVDMSQDMIDKAINNANRRSLQSNINIDNMRFYVSEIEDMSAVINDEYIDCVLSNCVLNLLPNKFNGFKEIYRVLKPNGGRICLSDIALKKELPEFIANDINTYVSCIGGSILAEEYEDLLKKAGFKHIKMINKNVDMNIWKQPEGSCLINKEDKDDKNNENMGCCAPSNNTGCCAPTGNKENNNLNKDHPLNVFDEKVFNEIDLND